MDIQHLFSEAARLEASDLHLLAGFAPIVRVNGALQPLEKMVILSKQDTEQLVLSTVSSDQKELLVNNRELDYSITSSTGRFRANAYYQQDSLAGAFRLIPSRIKSIDDLNLPSICHELVKLRQGLVLVTGPTGHGKSTAIASMIDSINQTKSVHVVTIEDPIEYVYSKSLSIISQREMHSDSLSWNIALRSVLREDPDVVLIGEMRDYETMASALTIAETGHLVFTTLHTNSASQTIDRIVDVFPENQQQQIRLQLSNVLEAVVSLRLVPSISGGRVPIAEILTASSAVRTTIRDGKSHLLDNVILTSFEQGMVSLETALTKAVREGRISPEVAASFAIRPEEISRLLK